MKLIIAGSRTITDSSKLKEGLQQSPFKIKDISRIITGGADGVDNLAIEFAMEEKINFEVIYPDYENNKSRLAPILRNEEMVEKGDTLLAIWDGQSNGTKSIIEKANKSGLEVYVHNTGSTLSDF